MNVFVYGTLMHDFGNHRVMEAAFGRSLVHGKDWEYGTIIRGHELTMWEEHRGFPFLRETNSPAYIVRGEVYFDVPNLYPLDRLEGYPHFYNRKKLTVHANDLPYEAWAYYINDFTGNTQPVPEGDWREFKRGVAA